MLAGMGMGGGTLLIPALTLICALPQHSAQFINMVVFIPTAIAALIVHKKEGRIELKRTLFLMLCGLVGGAIGAIIAYILDADFLRHGFGAFLCVLAVIRFFKKQPDQ
ncbi:MAG: sulfite exporter TauE/SafE family protein [Clostridia bacterium]|nr:sulfite exporter TauE/SafE family protein [Clostridia bacterium]